VLGLNVLAIIMVIIIQEKARGREGFGKYFWQERRGGGDSGGCRLARSCRKVRK
jgi:hypothetical protein